MKTAAQIEPIPLPIADMQDWHSFAADNREALEDQYGSVETALRHALDGGLLIGGGAAPLFLVYFED